MIEDREINLNINKISRMQQQLDLKLGAAYAFFILAGLWFLLSLLLTGGDISFLTMIPSSGFGLVGLFFYFQAYDIKMKLSKVPKNERENNAMKKIEFETAEQEIDGLILSKEIEYNPLYREKDTPNAHKVILNHTNQNLYYIVLDKTDMNESIKYRKVPYSEIVQAAVIIDDTIVSKSSLASKVGGTVVGGVLAGGVGAVVGGTNTKRKSNKEINEIELRIVVNDLEEPLIAMRLNEQPLKKPEKIKVVQNLADEWKTTIDLIIEEENKNSTSSSKIENEKTKINAKPNSNKKIKMLKDLAELKASGSISDEDFNKLKRDILDN